MASRSRPDGTDGTDGTDGRPSPLIDDVLLFFGGLVLGCITDEIFASKYAFDSIFRDLQDVHTSAPLQTQHLKTF